MKNILFFLTLLTMSITTTQAQKLENSTLWEISGNGLNKASYLFGTIHVSCDATLSKSVKEALNKTTQTVLEIDMDDPTLQSKMMNDMYMKDGKKLSDFVTDQEFAAIDSLFIKNVGISIKLVENFKPLFLTTMLLPKYLDCPMQSYETEIMNVAKKQKKDIKGLETIEEQLKVFEDIPYEDQIKELVKSAKDNLTSDKKLLAKMLEVYDQQDITKMLKMTYDEDSSVSGHQDKLLDNRNINWIPRIEVFAKEKPTFFAVGAGHLAGENGVIVLLRKAGFTVKAVK